MEGLGRFGKWRTSFKYKVDPRLDCGILLSGLGSCTATEAYTRCMKICAANKRLYKYRPSRFICVCVPVVAQHVLHP